MNPEQQQQLRAAFPAEQIGKLPKVTCKACRDRDSQCQQHTKSRCTECGNWISSAHIHIDYVGHADLTDRLLAVDPEWNWEPLGHEPDGSPKVDRVGGMWIRLTIAGVSRIGYGHPDGKQGGDALKETIGDALRNAAMRFGVALDLWKKEPHVEPGEPALDPAVQARTQLANRCKAMQLDVERVAKAYLARTGTALGVETDAEAIRAFAEELSADPNTVLGEDGAQ